MGFKIKLGDKDRALLTDITQALQVSAVEQAETRYTLQQLAQIISASRFTYSFIWEELMPVYKATEPDFDFTLKLKGVDGEGNVVMDAPIPAGHTLVVESDNPAAFAVTQDTADSRLLHCHVGISNADGTAAQAIVTARMFDPASNLVATGAGQVTVPPGDASVINEIVMEFPPPTV